MGREEGSCLEFGFLEDWANLHARARYVTRGVIAIHPLRLVFGDFSNRGPYFQKMVTYGCTLQSVQEGFGHHTDQNTPFKT